jgi:excisionase family DNA binding protein
MSELLLEYSNSKFAEEMCHYLDRTITVQEASALLGIEQSVVRRACIDGKILARKTGRNWLIDRSNAEYHWETEVPEERIWQRSGLPVKEWNGHQKTCAPLDLGHYEESGWRAVARSTNNKSEYIFILDRD